MALAVQAISMVKEDRLREKNKTIKLLKSQVRQLRKMLRQAESEIELMRTLWEEDIIDMAKKERRKKIAEKRKDTCPQCGNSTVSATLLGIWKLTRCDACDYFNREQLEEGGED